MIPRSIFSFIEQAIPKVADGQPMNMTATMWEWEVKVYRVIDHKQSDMIRVDLRRVGPPPRDYSR